MGVLDSVIDFVGVWVCVPVWVLDLVWVCV